MGPHPTVARVRHAVRAMLGDLESDSLVLVACSGGADSLALADAVAFEAPRAGLRAGAVTVDHGLQPGSLARAEALAERLRGWTLHPVEVATVAVQGAGGTEAAARRARYAALDVAVCRSDAGAVLLGHTRDDQAETVLLGLARGSGTRSLAGMAPRSGVYRRPLLDVDRATTRAACAANGIDPWDDPHNQDPAYLRVRTRVRALPVLENELGPGIADALARTAEQCRADADALDAWAARATDEAVGAPTDSAGSLRVDVLATLPTAVRRRVLRRAALAAGCPGTDLFAVHIGEVDGLITRWHGQRGIDLPGGIRVVRVGGRLRFDPAARHR